MKVMLVGGDLTPGHDGVGDYLRIMAKDLSGLGHKASILSLNERKTTEVIKEESNEFPVMRVPGNLDWTSREKLAVKFINEYKPDVISIHFVLYSWHRKGLPLKIPSRFYRLTKSYPVHIMFHELTIGVSEESPLRHRVIGGLQRELVVKRLAKLPQVKRIDTNTLPYAKLLEMWGVKAGVLPLFGNIPIVNVAEEERQRWWEDYFSIPRKDVYVAGSFGSLKGDVLSLPFLKSLHQEAERRGKKLLLVVAGGLTEAGEKYFKKVSEECKGTVIFVNLGRLSVRDVSLYFSSLDIGIGATPWLYIAKSGTATAMMEHGIPVAVSRDDLHIPGIVNAGIIKNFGSQVAKFGQPGFQEWLANTSRCPPRELHVEVAKKFVESLSV